MKKIYITMLTIAITVICTIGIYAATEWAYSDYGIFPAPENVNGVIMKSTDRLPATLTITFNEVDGAEEYRIAIHDKENVYTFTTENPKLQLMTGVYDWLKLGGDYVFTVQALADNEYGMISEPEKVMSASLPKFEIPQFQFSFSKYLND